MLTQLVEALLHLEADRVALVSKFEGILSRLLLVLTGLGQGLAAIKDGPGEVEANGVINIILIGARAISSHRKK